MAFDGAMPVTSRRSSPKMRVRPDDSMATSVPMPMAMRTSAWARGSIVHAVAHDPHEPALVLQCAAHGGRAPRCPPDDRRRSGPSSPSLTSMGARPAWWGDWLAPPPSCPGGTPGGSINERWGLRSGHHRGPRPGHERGLSHGHGQRGSRITSLSPGVGGDTAVVAGRISLNRWSPFCCPLCRAAMFSAMSLTEKVTYDGASLVGHR